MDEVVDVIIIKDITKLIPEIKNNKERLRI